MVVTDLTGKDAYRIMQEFSVTKEKLFKFFRYDSEIWKVIFEHIAHAEDCVLINRRGDVVCHHGSGPAIHLRGWGLSILSIPSPDFFRFEINIQYVREDTDDLTLFVPVELLVNFTTTGFNAWVEDLREKRDEERDEKNFEILKKMVEKYPKETRKVLREMKKV